MDLAVLISFVTLIGLTTIMLSTGLTVQTEELTRAIRKPRAAVDGLLANLVLVPLVTAVLLSLLGATPMVSIGFLTLAVCPGAPVGPTLTAQSKGDVPYATGQMVILAAVSALVSPLLLKAMLARTLPETQIQIDSLAIVTMLLLIVGIGLNRCAPQLTRRVVKPIGLVANLLLIGMIALPLLSEYQALALIRPFGWICMVALIVGSLGIGWICGGPTQAKRKALALTTASRNIAVALAIVSKTFTYTSAVTAVIAYGLISMIATLLVARLFARMPTTA